MLGIGAFFLVHGALHACTIFTLTDSNRVLFGNNEDGKEPHTRIWFVPATRHRHAAPHYGCAFVGYDNDWGQGGVNTAGVAFDWVAGYHETWERDPAMKSCDGNPAEEMLASCANVEDAVVFFRTHWEPSFATAKILVADRSGASVIIGAAAGTLDVRIMHSSRGFGSGGAVVAKMMRDDSSATVLNAAQLLRSARQQGKCPTQYSSIYDLTTGTIYLFATSEQRVPAVLDITRELKKGRHSYSIPRICGGARIH